MPVANPKSIDFTPKKEAQKERSLSCVDFSTYPQLAEAPKRQIDDDLQNEFTREREDDLTGKIWNEELGEYIQLPTKAKRHDGKIEHIAGAIKTMQGKRDALKRRAA